jgi:hypothetical protein
VLLGVFQTIDEYILNKKSPNEFYSTHLLEFLVEIYRIKDNLTSIKIDNDVGKDLTQQEEWDLIKKGGRNLINKEYYLSSLKWLV